jgi:hypothetical protein
MFILGRGASLIRFIRRQLSATSAVLSGFTGNPKACLITEPFWGIPFNLYVTDRLGRRRTSLIFDLLSWSLPTLIWAFA